MRAVLRGNRGVFQRNSGRTTAKNSAMPEQFVTGF
jgi:hypothetical protein